ncbi:MAG TPA: hypothetical protein V6C81_13905 [Planktothrix sp.]
MLLLANVIENEKMLWQRGRELAAAVECTLWKAALTQTVEQITANDLSILNQKRLHLQAPNTLLESWRHDEIVFQGLNSLMSKHIKPWRPLIRRLETDQFALVLELQMYLQGRSTIRNWVAPFSRFMELSRTSALCIQHIERQLDLLAFIPMGNALSEIIPYEDDAEDLRQIGYSFPKKQHRLLAIFGQNGQHPQDTTTILSEMAHDTWWAPWEIADLPLSEVVSSWFGVLPMSQWYQELLNTTCGLARSATAFLFYENICFVCERPTIIERDQQGRLHSETGAAIRFADGFEIFSWHGVTTPAHIITQPEKLTPPQIENTSNAEIRRIMIERYGVERFILDAGAELVETDEFGTLYAKYLTGDEPLVMVRVTNKTPNPDGTTSEYFLRVPPSIKTAKAAVAWTFAMQENEYKPRYET